MTEIETKIKNCLQNICSENDRWLPSFLEALNNFPNIFFLRDFDDHSDEQQSCQVKLKFFFKKIFSDFFLKFLENYFSEKTVRKIF